MRIPQLEEAAFSPGGATIFVRFSAESGDSKLLLLDSVNWKATSVLKYHDLGDGHSSTLDELLFDPTDTKFLLPTVNGYELRRNSNGNLMRTFKVGTEGIPDSSEPEKFPRFSPNGKVVAWDEMGKLHFFLNDAPARIVPLHVLNFAFSPDSSAINMFGTEGIYRVKAENNEVRKVASGAFAGALSIPGTAYTVVWAKTSDNWLYDTKAGNFLLKYESKPPLFQKGALASSNFIAYVTTNDALTVLDLAARKCRPVVWQDISPFMDVGLGVFGTEVVGELFEILQFTSNPASHAPAFSVGHVHYSSDAKLEAALPGGRVVLKSDTAGTCIYTLGGRDGVRDPNRYVHEEPLVGSLVLHDRKRLVTWSNDGFIREWSLEDTQVRLGKPAKSLARDHDSTIPEDGLHPLVSPDGFWQLDFTSKRFEPKEDGTSFDLVLRSKAHPAFVLPVKMISASRSGGVGGVFSPDSKYFVWLSGQDLEVHVFDLTALHEIRTPIQNKDGVFDLSFSPDGCLLMTKCYTALQIWDARHSFSRVVSLIHADGLTKAWFSADSQYVVALDSKGIAQIWASEGYSLLGRFLVGDQEAAQFDPRELRIYQATVGKFWRLKPPVSKSVSQAIEDFERRTATGLDLP
jgi:WD40 repeat protein